MVYATPKDRILNELRSKANIQFTVDDLSNEVDFSEKTIRKYVDVLVREKMIKANEEAGTTYYVYEDTETLFTGEIAPLRAIDMVTEIASKYAYLRDINRIGIENINKYLTTLSIKDAFDEYLSDIDTRIGKLSKSGRGAEDKSNKDRLIKLDYIINNGLEIPDEPVIIDCPTYEFDEKNPLKIAGTDASTKLEEFQVNFGFPVYVNVAFSVGAGVVAEYPQKPGDNEHDKFLMPKHIRTAAEEYMEDMTPSIGSEEEEGLNPKQYMNAIYSLENVVHSKVDEEAIVRWSPDILYRDGPILPSHMDYLDLLDPKRAAYTRRATSRIIAVKSFASANQVNMYGIVKNSRKRLLARVVDYLLSEKWSEWRRYQVGMDVHLFSPILKNGQCTPLIKENPYCVYVFDDRIRSEGEKIVNRDEIMSGNRLGKKQGLSYFKQLEELTYYWSYLKDRLGGLNRYEFFDDSMQSTPEDQKELGWGVGNSIAYGILMSGRGEEIVPHKSSETLPEPTAKAHTESGMWRNKVADSLKMEFFKVFRSLYSGGVK